MTSQLAACMRASSAAVTLVAAGSLGCSHNLYSPPARPMPLEAPRTLDTGKSSISLSGGRSGALFGPEVAVGTVTGRRGVADGVEATVEGSVIHVFGDSAAPVSRDIVSGRAGAKVQLGTRHVAATAGLGAGTSAGGPFLAPDLGVVAGYDNDVLIPFVSLHGMLSSPLGARDVDVTPADQARGTFVGRPRFTKGAGATLGGRLPLGDPHSAGTSGALYGGMSFMKLFSHGEQEGFMGFGGGGEIIF